MESFSAEPLLNILELIFAGAPLGDVLSSIAQLVESQVDGMLCTVWLPDEDGKHVRCAAAPSIRDFWIKWGSWRLVRRERRAARPYTGSNPYMRMTFSRTPFGTTTAIR